MRVLITGVTGFAGSHLADYLLENQPDVEVWGIYRWRSRRENLEGVWGRLHMVECDLRDYTSVHLALQQARPDAIFHLAAQSFVPSSWKGAQRHPGHQHHRPDQPLRGGALPRPRPGDPDRLLVGGVRPRSIPTRCRSRRTTRCGRCRPYAVSKVAQDMMAYQYFQSYGLKTVRTRGFNHTGPRPRRRLRHLQLRQADRLDRARPAGAGDQGRQPRGGARLHRRARHGARLLAGGDQGEAGRGLQPRHRIGITIQALLDRLLSLSTAQVRVEQDPERMRPSDVVRLIGDSSKFRRDTGWEPQVPFEKTLRDTLQYWRDRLKK
jgi:GDP-4-dehydro-6-deoxy-D-mannose reductase